MNDSARQIVHGAIRLFGVRRIAERMGILETTVQAWMRAQREVPQNHVKDLIRAMEDEVRVRRQALADVQQIIEPDGQELQDL